MDIFKILLTIVQQAGTKLPAIWPFLIHIASDLKEIAKIMGWQTTLSSAAPDDTRTQFLETTAKCGVDEDEAVSVLEGFGSIASKLMILIIFSLTLLLAGTSHAFEWKVTRSTAVDILAVPPVQGDTINSKVCPCLQGGPCICGDNCYCGSSSVGSKVCKDGVCTVAMLDPSVCANCPPATTQVRTTTTTVRESNGYRFSGRLRARLKFWKWRPFQGIRARRGC